MLNDLRIIGRDLGGLLVILGAVMFAPPLLFSPVDGLSSDRMQAFLLPALTSIAIGLTLRIAARTDQETELKHGLILAPVAWIVFPLISTIPFLFLMRIPFLDALFQTMSNWTATGFLLYAPEDFPPILLFWNSITGWVGGMGIVTVMVAILSSRGKGGFALYTGEGRGAEGQETTFLPNLIATVRSVWRMYLLLTGIAIGILWLLRLSPYDAIISGMTISTASYHPHSGGLSYYRSFLIEIVALVILVVWTLPFPILHELFRGRIRPLLADVQFRAFLLLTLLGVSALTLELVYQGRVFSEALWTSSFHFISALTTAGQQIAPNLHSSEWSPTAQLIMAIPMIIGGAAASTAGGIKLIRAVTAYRGTGWWFKKASLPPGAVVSFRLGERRIPDEEANRIVAEANLITLVWILFLFISTVVLIHVVPARYQLSDVFLEVASAQGNVGLTTGISAPDLHPLGKLVLVFSMWIGRLEIIPVLMLFRSLFKGLRPV